MPKRGIRARMLSLERPHDPTGFGGGAGQGDLAAR